MCRLAYVPTGTEVSGRVLGLLEILAAAQGRDGVGVGTWKEKGFAIVKGQEAKPAQLVKELGDAPRGVLFHARLATSGGKMDELCQPFAFGETMTVHNGCWGDWRQALWALVANGGIKPGDGPINDSACAAALAAKAGRAALSYIDSGVFITWHKKERWPVVTVRRGDFAYSSAPGSDGGIVYASSFPESWPVKVMEFSNDSCAVLTPAGPYLIYGDKPLPGFKFYSAGYQTGYRGHHGRGDHWGGVA